MTELCPSVLHAEYNSESVFSKTAVSLYNTGEECLECSLPHTGQAILTSMPSMPGTPGGPGGPGGPCGPGGPLWQGIKKNV